MNKLKPLIIVLVFFCINIHLLGQGTNDTLLTYLDKKAQLYPELNSKVNISVSDVTIKEFLRAIAISNKVNFDIDENIKGQVVNNFNGVTIKELLVFMSKKYDLKIDFIGSIITLTQIPKVSELYRPAPLDITYDSINKTISFNFRNDSINLVTSQITKFSGNNVVFEPMLKDCTISCYIQKMPFENAMDKLAFSNNLKMTKSGDGFYLLQLDKQTTETNELPIAQRSNRRERSQEFQTGGETSNKQGIMQVKKQGNGTINVVAQKCTIADLVNKVSAVLNQNYFLLSEITGTVNLQIENATYEDFLVNLLSGTKAIFRKIDSYYVIGEKSDFGLKEIRIFDLQNRSVNKLVESFPKDITEELTIKEVPELNSIVAVGSQVRLDVFDSYIKLIDKSVPVVLIEVMIVYSKKTTTVSTGFNAGINKNTVATEGTVNPGMDFALSSTSINNIINSFNGFGWLNLSNVGPNFYIQLKALEENGFINITSTPRLSTLNSHEATLSIGNTEYYLEEQTNIIGTQNPQTNTTSSYKSVNADLKVTITPFVSGKEDITMDIEVEQSDFTSKISKFAPPGTVNRKFKSQIKIKNSEMILLGGLEDNTKSKSSSGWPILSRIPVIKWIFSSISKTDEKEKLNLFIKPTIIQ